MHRSGILACVFTFVFAAMLPGVAKADGEALAARTFSNIRDTVDRVEWNMADQTGDTVDLIRRLLNAGRVEAAIAAARSCVQQSRENARAAASYINQVADRGIRSLVSRMEFELARRVDHARNAAIDHLKSLLDRQEQVLSDALGN
ncbi:MAG: hypothetical protein P8L85_07980 [Rubripirellula sp.]|nr:hypothetical protein [Rubripirellula sp.]